MKIKINYFLIPIITILTSFFGSLITGAGMEWYKTIKIPDFAPPGYVIGIVWTTIFILSTISALISWNKTQGDLKKKIGILFLANALLNIFWSFVFFYKHFIGWAIIEAVILGLSVLLLIYFIRPVSKIASTLLFPYAIWVFFASYLTFEIWRLN